MKLTHALRRVIAHAHAFYVCSLCSVWLSWWTRTIHSFQEKSAGVRGWLGKPYFLSGCWTSGMYSIAVNGHEPELQIQPGGSVHMWGLSSQDLVSQQCGAGCWTMWQLAWLLIHRNQKSIAESEALARWFYSLCLLNWEKRLQVSTCSPWTSSKRNTVFQALGLKGQVKKRDNTSSLILPDSHRTALDTKIFYLFTWQSLQSLCPNPSPRWVWETQRHLNMCAFSSIAACEWSMLGKRSRTMHATRHDTAEEWASVMWRGQKGEGASCEPHGQQAWGSHLERLPVRNRWQADRSHPHTNPEISQAELVRGVHSQCTGNSTLQLMNIIYTATPTKVQSCLLAEILYIFGGIGGSV